MNSILSHLKKRNRHNINTFRNAPLAEISGSLGDLGTLLPLMIALAIQGSINLDATLVFSGLFNVVSGVAFGIPLPVQPMKAIASAAIAHRGDSSLKGVAGAGLWVGAAILVMSVTGLLRWAVKVVPIPVVKGIQLGAGLSLIIGAGSSQLQPLGWVTPVLDNRLWAIFAFLILIATQRLQRFPYALTFFLLGLLFALIQVIQKHHSLPWLSLWLPDIIIPRLLGSAASSPIYMAIGQLPLTTLNSIIAVSALAADLLPDVPTPSVTSIGLSVAMMNLTGTWFGAMPDSFSGNTLLNLLGQYPKSLLGIMVLAAGLELAKVGHSLNQGARDLWQESSELGDGASVITRRLRSPSEEERMERWTVMLMTTACILAFKNDAVGFLAGLLCHWAFRLSDRFVSKVNAAVGASERDPLLR
ncbi:hypothetical protein NQ176_g7772 [Zarea fungicola]|uniref:Uncharacterized protein n=1 Tax=Zarea fungicola TaxID=93591 RepID=A0ACC1MX09_9HYPO|nr:hypothetical protein NQ176_g7772 [Lecanicillium fungicola]